MPRPKSISNTPAARAWKAENQRTSTSSSLDSAENEIKKLKRPVVSYNGRERTITKLTDEYFPEMIDPALAITGAIAGGVVAGNLLDRLRMALKSPAEKDKTRRVEEIKRAQQAAKKPVKMPPMPKK